MMVVRSVGAFGAVRTPQALIVEHPAAPEGQQTRNEDDGGDHGTAHDSMPFLNRTRIAAATSVRSR